MKKKEKRTYSGGTGTNFNVNLRKFTEICVNLRYFA